MSQVRNLNIATKLMVWACALIVVFFATTTYLFRQVRQDAEVSRRIVSVHHDLDSAIQRMLERLYSVQDNIRRYKLLGNPEAVNFIVEDLTRFGEILDETLKRHPDHAEEWQDLTLEYEITLDPEGTVGGNLVPDATVQDWTDILEQSLLDNQADMETTLTALHVAGQRASDIGLYGLILCLALGVGGSFALAYHLNRSLGEVRRGIRDLGSGGVPRDVRVLSGDELGELALAFNAMAARLRREERMRADFIAMLSHEIRTPLTSVREAVDLVGSGEFGEVNDKQKRFLSIAEKESVRLSELLSRLLTVSHMESEELELSFELVEGNDFVRSVVERLAPTADAKGVRLEIGLSDEPFEFEADSGQLRLVLMNLAGNGIKFTPQGGSVTVWAALEDDNAVFRVADTGPGIPEKEQALIFHKYYRDPSVRESVDGAGLGLAISRRIVDAHGGTVQVESEPGRGAVFCVTLPIVQKG